MGVQIIPSDSPSLFAVLQTLQTTNPAAYAAVVRPNNPPRGIGGFLFDIPGDEEAHLRAVVTRHMVEDNTPITDHITTDPEQFTLRGLVAELVAVNPTEADVVPPDDPLPVCAPMAPTLTTGGAMSLVARAKASLTGVLKGGAAMPVGIASPLGQASRSVTALGLGGGALTKITGAVNNPSSVLPPAAQAALAKAAAFTSTLPTGTITSLLGGASARNAASRNGAANTLAGSSGSPAIATASIDITGLAVKVPSGQSLYNYFRVASAFRSSNPIGRQSRQSSAYLFFEQMILGKQLCSIETPWGIMLNMAVIDVRAIQSKETKDQTDFVVVFEKIRVAGSATITPGQMANRAAISAAQTTTNPGALTPTPGPVTASVFSLFNMGGL